MTNTRPRTFTALTEHPLPLDEDEVAAFAEDHPQLDPNIHVDALHEDYITLLAETAEWRVFTVGTRRMPRGSTPRRKPPLDDTIHTR